MEVDTNINIALVCIVHYSYVREMAAYCPDIQKIVMLCLFTIILISLVLLLLTTLDKMDLKLCEKYNKPCLIYNLKK
jgi:hypothetical protein